jgi:doublecortin-like kinase 1/2
VEDNLAVAVKVIDLSRLTSKQLAEVDAERFILQQFHHPHVVNMLNVFETASRLYYVLELLPGGDLFNKILQRGCFSERATKRIIKQIAEAVAAMHAMGIVHRDLKPENILCIEDSFTKQIDVKLMFFFFLFVCLVVDVVLLELRTLASPRRLVVLARIQLAARPDTSLRK